MTNLAADRSSEAAPVARDVQPARQALPVLKSEPYLPALAMQSVELVVIALVLHYALSLPLWPETAFASPTIQLLFCRAMRWRFAGHHRAGIDAYRIRRFDEAVAHHRASFELFDRHRWIDRWRFLLFGTAGRTPYRTMALGNMAYAEAMRGNRSAAVSLFEEALRLTPGYANAEVGLAMLTTAHAEPSEVRDGPATATVAQHGQRIAPPAERRHS